MNKRAIAAEIGVKDKRTIQTMTILCEMRSTFYSVALNAHTVTPLPSQNTKKKNWRKTTNKWVLLCKCSVKVDVNDAICWSSSFACSLILLYMLSIHAVIHTQYVLLLRLLHQIKSNVASRDRERERERENEFSAFVEKAPLHIGIELMY